MSELIVMFKKLVLVRLHAAVANLLQDSTCCVFRDALLQTSVVKSGYLSYCCLFISSNQSGLFTHRNATHW